MYYIVYDLEFNQKDKSSSTEIASHIELPFEVIQIGALKLNDNFEIIDKFNSLIKPSLYKDIHPYIEELTKITTDQVNSSPNFLKVFENFKNFIGNSNEAILCVWGQSDVKVLMQNLSYHNIPNSLLPNKYIDIQLHASKYFKAPSGSRIGLRNAIELLNLSINNTFHNAFNDALYTTDVFRKIYNDSFTVQEYNYKNNAQKASLKKEGEKVNFPALINQIEKMYGRTMTSEEKEIIKLSYFMGKTSQFTTKNK